MPCPTHPVLDGRLLDLGLEPGVYEPSPTEGTEVGDDDVLSLVVRLKQTFQVLPRYVLQSFDAARAAHRGQMCKSGRDNEAYLLGRARCYRVWPGDLGKYKLMHIFDSCACRSLLTVAVVIFVITKLECQ